MHLSPPLDAMAYRLHLLFLGAVPVKINKRHSELDPKLYNGSTLLQEDTVKAIYCCMIGLARIISPYLFYCDHHKL